MSHKKPAQVSMIWVNIVVYVGTMQTLDARHIELFLCDGYQKGSWEYQLIGSRDVKERVAGASGAIFDVKNLKDISSCGNSLYSTLIEVTVSFCCHQRKKNYTITWHTWKCCLILTDVLRTDNILFHIKEWIIFY